MTTNSTLILVHILHCVPRISVDMVLICVNMHAYIHTHAHVRRSVHP